MVTHCMYVHFELTGMPRSRRGSACGPPSNIVLNPDEYDHASQARRAHDGWSGAIFGVVSLGRLLGTSNKL